MLVVIVTNLSAMMIDLVNQCKFLKVKMQFKDLLKKPLIEVEYCEEVIKNDFKKQSITTEENE